MSFWGSTTSLQKTVCVFSSLLKIVLSVHALAYFYLCVSKQGELVIDAKFFKQFNACTAGSTDIILL